jgi:hypothetical protein
MLDDAPIRFNRSASAWIQWDWDHARIPAECVQGTGQCAVHWAITTFYYLQVV